MAYVAGWSTGRGLAELKSSLETIRSTAAEIINSIDGHIAEIQKEQTAAQEQPTQEAEPDKDTFTIYASRSFPFIEGLGNFPTSNFQPTRRSAGG